MTSLEERMADVEKYATSHPESYYASLIRVAGGVRAAAMLDLAIDGDTYWPDMRRRPFAGNEELKRLYRESQEAQVALRDALMRVIWADRDA